MFTLIAVLNSIGDWGEASRIQIISMYHHLSQLGTLNAYNSGKVFESIACASVSIMAILGSASARLGTSKQLTS
jgi:hypothetical protein